MSLKVVRYRYAVCLYDKKKDHITQPVTVLSCLFEGIHV